MLIIQYILPGIIIIATIIMMIVLWKAYGKDSRMHLHSSKEFVVHTIGSMLFICIGGMSILMLDGLWAVENIYKWLHEDFIEPTKGAFPTIVSVMITFLGMILTFRLIHPRIGIYPLAVYELGEKGKYWLTFHVQNLGWSECIDMKAELYDCHFQDRGYVFNKYMKDMKLQPLAQSTLIGWRFGHSNDNSYLIETDGKYFKKNIFANSDHFLELRIKLTHPISRITKVFVQDFMPTDIHYGEFIEDCLVVYNNGTGKPINSPKVKAFHRARRLKIAETFFLLSLLVISAIYIVLEPLCEMPIRIFQCSFYLAMTLATIIELLRQYAKRPMQSEKSETNI